MRINPVLSAVAFALAISWGFAPVAASAESVNLEKKFTDDWNDVLGGSAIDPTEEGNQGTGIPFAFKGRFVYVGLGDSVTVKFKKGGIENPKGKLVFYTLINTGFGTPNATQGNIKFVNDLGDEVAFILIGNKNVRDYLPGPFTNKLSPHANPPAVQWYLNDQDSRLDMQILALPKSWKGTRVVSMTINGTGPGMDALWLSAVTYFPEPLD